MARTIAFDFIKISVVYFLIGIFWMGILFFLGVSGPTHTVADEAYHWAMYHVMLIGWASFAIMGILYYAVPKMVDKEGMHSRRLGSIHFWLTNIAFPIGIIDMVAASYLIDSLEAQGLTDAQVYGSASVAPYLFTFLIAVLVAYAAQFLFAYNIFRTLRKT